MPINKTNRSPINEKELKAHGLHYLHYYHPDAFTATELFENHRDAEIAINRPGMYRFAAVRHPWSVSLEHGTVCIADPYTSLY